MNKEGNKSNGTSLSTIITRVLVGSIILGGAYYAYRKCTSGKKSVEEADESMPEESEVVTEEKCVENKKIDYSDKSDLMSEMINELINDPIFGKEDIIVLRSESDIDYDDIHKAFTLLEYMPKSENFDGYFSVTIKVSDTLYSKNRGEMISDPLFENLKVLADDLRKSKAKYNKIKFSSKALGFYFNSSDGRKESDFKYYELRDLESIKGFRYIEFRFYHCEYREGIQYMREFIKLLHPDGGEEDNELSCMPVILADNDNGIALYEGNSIVKTYLKP